MAEEIRLQVGDSLRLSDDDLTRSVSDTENAFIERKTINDTKGWLHTVVAFANSCPESFPGLLYIGVDNDGNIQKHSPKTNFETIQKTLGESLRAAYPPIYYLSKTLRKDGREFLAVIVPGSPDKPHFTGKSYVRVGPETREASEDQFGALIAERTGVGRVLRELVGKHILTRVVGAINKAVLLDYNQHFVTVRYAGQQQCYPISKITINFAPHEKVYLLEVG
jgi:hypothetical protein